MTKTFCHAGIAALLLLLNTSVASAYMGPGIAAGVLTTLIGIISSLGLMLIAILWYPLRRIMQRFSRKPEDSAQ
jgi:flagellar motor component MotA